MKRNFKIVFYKSESGELVKVKEFHRQAEELQDLVSNPPEEFFDMLEAFFPVHGWAEMENLNSTVFVIFAPRNRQLEDVEEGEFQEWLNHVQPSDFEDFPE